ncbi:restriction endonuclease subunit S [Halomonas neptunia]|nr:restriction endonuclease subunit S [Halomonas neptunia]
MCELVIDCPHSTPKWTDTGIIVLRNQNIRNGELDLSNPSFTDEEHFRSRVRRALPRAGDIVFTREAPMGEVCLISENLKCCLGQRQVLLRAKPEVDSRYLFWALQSKYVQSQISWNEGTGTTVSNVRIPVLKDLKIPRHECESEIADILSYIAKKITLNTQINQTLEQMAQAIFKSWFVDFDPVIDNALEVGNPIPEPLAKRAARRKAMWAAGSEKAPARLPAETRRLFPDRFEEDEVLGWVPAGWTIKPLDQVARYQNGLALQKFRPNEGEEFLPVLKIAQLRARKTDGVEKASVNIKPECIVHNGDVVFSWSGTLMIDIWSGGKAALNQHLFKVTSDQYPKWFYFLWTQRHLELFQRIAADKAVTMGHIKRQHLAEAFCLVPEEQLISKAGESIRPLIEKMLSSRLESEELTQLRDTLLPKLLSGELKLPEAEAAVDTALETEFA